MTLDEQRMAAIRAHLDAIYLRNHELTEPNAAEHQYEFGFHVLDAADDLLALAELLSQPAAHTPDEAHQIMRGVLYHAVGHLVAAARLYDTFIDTFAREPERPLEQAGRPEPPSQ